MSVTIKDVAKQAGVSRSAVSRAFTEGASVSEKTRKKVEKAAKALGYVPNFIASSLTTRRTKLIGLVSDNFHNPMFLQIFDLFTRLLQERGLRPLLVNLSQETDPKVSLNMLKQYRVDGVIVASSTLPLAFSKSFKDAGIPVVHSFGRFSSVPYVHVVGIDNVECGRMAARLLVKHKYKHIGFMGGPEQATSTQDRWLGFKEVLIKNKQIKLIHFYSKAYSFEAGRESMIKQIASNQLAQAYFCGDDILSIGAISALKDAGLRVPEDIGIIGLNDTEMASWENNNLTTIHQPIEQIISSSIELVISIINDPERHPEARLFATKIVERGTLRQPSSVESKTI